MSLILFLALAAVNLYFIGLAGGWVAFVVAASLAIIFAIYAKSRIIVHILPFFIIGFGFSGLIAINLAVASPLSILITFLVIGGWVAWLLLQPNPIE